MNRTAILTRRSSDRWLPQKKRHRCHSKQMKFCTRMRAKAIFAANAPTQTTGHPATPMTELNLDEPLPSEPTAKWGDVLNAGFQILPDSLIRGQHLLKLSATDLAVIANLNQAWWYADRWPYLTPGTIARRMGVSERTVQRSLSRLRARGFLEQRREKLRDGRVRYTHDLSGLREALEPLARRDINYSPTRRARLLRSATESLDRRTQRSEGFPA